MVKQKNVELGLRIRKAVNYIIYVENLSNIGEVADIIERDKSNLSKALNGDTQYANVYIDAICKKYSIIDREIQRRTVGAGDRKGRGRRTGTGVRAEPDGRVPFLQK